MPKGCDVTSDFSRRTLRTWSGIAGVHGLVIGITISAVVPWKTAWVNAAVLGYAILQVVVAVGLWRQAFWGWRLGLLAGVIGLVSGVLVITGLLLSYSKPLTYFGNFYFWLKLGLLILAGINIMVFDFSTYKSVSKWTPIPELRSLHGSPALPRSYCGPEPS